LNCELAQTTVHGYFDGELDAVRSAEFARHLENCAECRAALEGIESLHTLLQRNNLYEHASPQLRERIRDQFPVTTGGVSAWRRWSLMPAFGVLALVCVFTLAFFLVQSQMQSRQIAAELVDAHVRALQPGHLTDVTSTDQHTVKPWFDGKLDFIPPVTDYSEQGFPLVGGRLDAVDGHNIAALVYSRRRHFIDLFVLPYRDTDTSLVRSGSRQGYNWIWWQSGEMRFCLVSDVARSDLEMLKDLIHP
jgi:anti-sigma factor RsiW